MHYIFHYIINKKDYKSNNMYKDLSNKELEALVLNTMIDHTEIDVDVLLSSTTLSIDYDVDMRPHSSCVCTDL